MTPEEQAAKGRERDARYNASPKGRARLERYRASAKWRETHKRLNDRHNPRRVVIGCRHVGVAATAEEAAVLNAHIKERVRGFIAGFATGTQAESV